MAVDIVDELTGVDGCILVGKTAGGLVVETVVEFHARVAIKMDV